jgi:flagellar motor protein MotB
MPEEFLELRYAQNLKFLSKFVREATHMRRISFLPTVILLFVFLGVTTFALAQHGDQGEQHDNQGKQQVKEDKAHYKQQQKIQKHDQKIQKQQYRWHAQQQQHRTQQQQQAQQLEQRSAWHQHRARSWESEHQTWQRRGGYNGCRIPDNYFRSYYGRGHYFRIYSLPFMVVGGAPRFQYRGYWFTAVDPYPEYWGDNWYQNDDVYVDYVDDGYYLYNRRYMNRPGIAITINL